MATKIKTFARIRPTKQPTKQLRVEEKKIFAETSEDKSDGRHVKSPGVSYEFKFSKVS